MDKKYYFAYGSNLDTNQMNDRIGKWIKSEKAFVEGYKRVYNVWSGKNWNGWAANLEKTNKISDRVYGVVYVINNEQLKTLTEKYEHTRPTLISVVLENGEELKSVNVYVWPKEEPSHEPPKPYREAIIRGLEQHGYAQYVIEEVKREF